MVLYVYIMISSYIIILILTDVEDEAVALHTLVVSMFTATTSCSEIIKSKQYIQLIYTLEILNWYLKQLGSVCGGVASFNMF